jgi:uncharacterized protein
MGSLVALMRHACPRIAKVLAQRGGRDYIAAMGAYEWDENKAERNWRKHGVTFDHAVTAIEDELAIEDIDDCGAEERWNLLGVCDGVILHVTYTMRGDHKRIISARRATAHEQDRYRKSPR